MRVHKSGKFLELNDKRYTFLGTNYWYGVNLGAKEKGDRARLVKELDQLVELGISNLRIMAGSQGDSSNHRRISPSLQPTKDEWDEDIFQGFDFFLDEMRK